MFNRGLHHLLPELAGLTALLMVAMSWAMVFGERAAAPRVVVHILSAKPVKTVKTLVADPRRTPSRPLAIARAVTQRALPSDAVAAKPLPPQDVAPDPATLADEAGRVAQRLSDRVPSELSPYFDTFIYVSKAAARPWGQRLFLFHKNADGTLAFEQSFSVSTGREKSEQYFTATPTGLF